MQSIILCFIFVIDLAIYFRLIKVFPSVDQFPIISTVIEKLTENMKKSNTFYFSL